MQAYQLANRVTTANAPLNGGKAYFYLTTTTTPATVYEDAALGTPLSNPVVANSAGFFPELVYLDPTKTYRCKVTTSAGATIFDADPINTAEGGTGIETADIADGAVTGDKLADLAIEDKLGYTPADDADVLALQTLTGALTGVVMPFLRSSAPTGWVKGNGGTIGDASSGATTRANADTADLFALIWALDATNFPITTSAGAASTRGATAAEDYAAHKRLPLPDLRADFVRGLDDSRGVDTSRLLGSEQLDAFQGHIHKTPLNTNFTGSGTPAFEDGSTPSYTDYNSGSPVTDGVNGTPRTAAETRPRNIALLYCIKL